jgi:hypothetical protein
LPSAIPAKFKPVTDRFDHTRRKVMIPMRDGGGNRFRQQGSACG